MRFPVVCFWIEHASAKVFEVARCQTNDVTNKTRENIGIQVWVRFGAHARQAIELNETELHSFISANTPVFCRAPPPCVCEVFLLAALLPLVLSRPASGL